MARFTLETSKGKLIDIVDGANEAVNNVYILKGQIPVLLNRCAEFGVTQMDSTMYKLLKSEGLIKVKQ